jgi:hypothetical protein
MPQQKLNLFQFPALSIGTALPPSAAYAACGMMQSIFSSAARLQVGAVGKESWKPRR